MFSFLSLPKPALRLQARSAFPSPLCAFASVVKAFLAAFLLTLFLALPSHAQWSVVDQNGNPISQNGDGSYRLFGTPSGSGTSTYPADLNPDYIYVTCLFGPYYAPQYFGGTPLYGLSNLTGGLGAQGWAQNNYNGNPYFYNGTVNELLQGTIQNSTDAPLLARFQYVGGGTPPDYLNVLVSDNAYARAYVESDYAFGLPFIPDSLLSAHVSVSDDLGLSLSADASPLFPGSQNDPPQMAGGRRLLRLPVVGSEAKVSVPVHFAVNQVNEVPYGSWEGPSGYGAASSYFSAGIGATVQQDTRAVTLHRDGARQVPKTAGLGSKVYGEWTDPDGTGHGDTTFSYQTIAYAGKSKILVEHVNWQTFTPDFQGMWPVWSSTWESPSSSISLFDYRGDPNDPLYLNSSEGSDDQITASQRTQDAPAVIWSWSPNESEDWELYGKWSIPYGAGDPESESPHDPITFPVSYSASESAANPRPGQDLSALDGATVSAQYFLTVHDPVEGWHTNGPSYEVEPLTFPNAVAEGQPESQPAGATVHTAIPKCNDYIDYGPGVRGFGGVLTTGGAVLPLVIGDAATGPVGIGVTGLIVAIGFTLGLYDPQEPKWTKDVPTDFSDFAQDIVDQQKIASNVAVADPRTDTNFVLVPSIARFADARRAADLANMSPAQQQQNWIGTGNGGKFTVSVTDILHEIVQPYAAYQFDTAGLIVDANNNPVFALANVKRTGAIEAIRTWTWVPDETPGH